MSTSPTHIKKAVTDTVSHLSDRVSEEGSRLNSRIESQPARIPSSAWMGFALGSMAVSAGLEVFSKKKEYGNFIGLWAPCFLLMGIYSKLVKLDEKPSRR